VSGHEVRALAVARVGHQFRQRAGTRSWEEAERKKRELEDQLSGRVPVTKPEDDRRMLLDCIDLFLKDKRLQGIQGDALEKYTRDTARLRKYCEGHKVITVDGVTRELLTEYLATWNGLYPSSFTRAKMRDNIRAFLRYCYECRWLPRVPILPKIQVNATPTLPLTSDEFKRLLKATKTLPNPEAQVRCHALFQLMRWSGLAIMDALTLPRADIVRDKVHGVHCVVTSRQKTGTDVLVPLPPAVAKELLGVPNLNPKFFFWTGKGQKDSLTCRWSKRYVSPVFKAAGLNGQGSMTSHRLRDTFACDLLEKGVPLEEVSKMLGHTSIKTTEKHYSAWVKGRQDRLIKLVTDVWSKKDR